jgi:long-chain-acyl-CoA dehydrogenase
MLCRQAIRRLGLSLRERQTLSHRVCSTRLQSNSAQTSDDDAVAQSKRLELAEAGNMMDIGIRKIFTEDHDILRQSVRRFFQEEIAPYHDQWELDGQISREAWLAAGRQGLLGVDTPEEHGGIGSDWLSASIIMEEQSYVNCTGPGFALHSHITMPYISHIGSKEQIDKYIPRMMSGECISCIAMTEPGAGSDLQGIRTTAKQDGDDWIINGSKVFITNGQMADLAIVVAITNTEAKTPAHGISLFLVDAGTPGFKKGRTLKKVGFKAQDTAELFFDDVRVPSSALLGKVNKGFYYLMQELPQERLLIALMGQAANEFMFETTRKYVRERKAFGKTLANLQTVQHNLAEMKTEICVGRAFVDNCLKTHNEVGLDSQQASMAKYWITDLQNTIASRCLQLHGGWGYMWEYPIAKAFVDSRLQPIYAGSNEIMKELIARTIITDK